MSKADEMFEELGYIKYLENEETLIYKHNGNTFRISLTFDKRDFAKTFEATEGYWVSNSEGWYAQDFKNDFDKYSAGNGYWSNMWHRFTMQELQAINEKVKELGWNEKI